MTDETEHDSVELAPGPSGYLGVDVIAYALKTLPNSPGVYRMYDPAGDCLYVGKARSLKKRVSNYTRIGGHTNRIARMIAGTASMEFVTTRTESEALLLEANLIKRLKPRFNVLMRDDKSFPFILISREHEAPQLTKHRGARNRKGDYFGPFASAGAVNRTINTLQRAFLLRSCTDSVYESRTRPCLLYQIKRCSGPCTGEINLADYDKLVDEAVSFLKGNSDPVRQKLRALMEEAADKLEYEHAATFRNRLHALAHVTADQTINPAGIEEADVFAAHSEGGQTCIQVFFFRTGQNWGNRAYFPRADKSLTTEEVLEAFIAQFYDDKPVPRLILTSHLLPSEELMAEALALKADRRIEIAAPQRGDKRDLVQHAVDNAREALGRRMAETSSQARHLEGVARVFGLDRTPRRIEVYDNSHIMGTNAIGAMIVAGPEGLAKAHYRKFNIKSDMAPGDDFAMMREVLTRRFKRLLKENEADDRGPDERGQTPSETILDDSPLTSHEKGLTGPALTQSAQPAQDDPHRLDPVYVRADQRGNDPFGATPMVSENTEDDDDDENAAGSEFPTWPDLVLIDGGKGQLAEARKVLETLGITGIALIGVAKGPDRDAGREHFHRPGREPIMLEPRDPVLYFIQRLRDEAHRFAIGSHRQKRKKDISINPLDDIAGIGPTRKRALLQHFGSAKAVSRAGIPDLMAVAGISQQMAQAIYDHFNETRS